MSVPEIDVDQLEALDPRTVQLIDVREPDEFEAARVPGAVSIPLMTIPDHVAALDRDESVYLICAVGGRSYNAAEYLRAHGYHAVNVAGGTKDWITRGKPFDAGTQRA